MRIVLNPVPISAPAVEPLTVEEAKLHLKIESTDDNYTVLRAIRAARTRIEKVCGIALITQTRECVMDRWPRCDWFYVPRPPLQSISSIVYVDFEGTSATWASSRYLVDTDSHPGRVSLAYSETYPTNILRPINGVRVRFIAGYGLTAESVPEDIRHAMKLMLSDFYEHREDTLVGQKATTLPLGARMLLAPYKVPCFG